MIELKEAYKKVLNSYIEDVKVVEGYETDDNYLFLFIPKKYLNDNEFVILDGVYDVVNKDTGELSELESRFVFCNELQQESIKKIDLRKVVRIKKEKEGK